MVKKGKGLLMAKSPCVPTDNWERKHQARGEDRISKLPDKVLCHILSFIPTKYAVRTCILSTRWKYIWASVPNLEMKQRQQRHFLYSGMESRSPVFLKFVDHVLSLRDSSDIEKFCLHCSCNSDGSDFSRIAGWIQTAITHNVAELDLQVEANYDKSKDRTLELPQCIFMSRTLVVLKLKSDCISYTPPASGNFGSLKILHVDIPYLDNELMENIISCCPVLEDLTIDALLELGAVMTSKISAAELKKLRLIVPHGTSFNDHDHEYYFFVNCPKLESFDLEQEISSNYVFENANLVKASLSLYSHGIETLQPKFSKRATSLLAGIAKVKYLSLSAHLLAVCCLPAFDNLNELKLVRHDCYNWDFLTELLNRSPNLEHLVLEYEFDEHDICLQQEDSDDEEKSLEDKEWNTPASVPTCLLLHLKTISIRGFHGYLHEQKAVKYLLQNSAVLHKMTIYTCDFLLTKEETYKEFSMFPRGSRDCLVEFIDNSIPEEDYY